MGDDTVTRDPTVQRSVEGYILILTGLHEETQEDDIIDVFAGTVMTHWQISV